MCCELMNNSSRAMLGVCGGIREDNRTPVVIPEPPFNYGTQYSKLIPLARPRAQFEYIATSKAQSHYPTHPYAS